MVDKSWVVYLLKCADNSLYCGVTNDLVRRLRQHNGEIKGGAKYTQARRPCELVYQEVCEDKSSAMQREYALKRLSRLAKQKLFL
ncbi:hypothetical protein CYQ88_08555 [Hydrogenovibrio sp. SC-1]|uniref:GIY-YIG nuclease family protein n=1 Tax=Hydrogenovibrio sp. SC-1 TaxID=2065820 RepID=UPI000C7E46C7|nr:GIY-YIG nuclease family protein [Hydrogenovibrio sp. SC-1]PLA74004.1 hypothetical protein CYQ88_08555 [Hydrogenovibrio sp. SC-1]